MADVKQCDINLERTVLSSLMLVPDAIHQVVDVLKAPEVFYKPQHQMIYAAMLGLYRADQPIDTMMLIDALRKSKKLNDVGGDLEVIDIATEAVSAANIEHHALIIMQYYLARNVARLGSDVLQSASEPGVDSVQLLDEVQQKLDDLNNQVSRKSEISWKEILKLVSDSVYELSDSPDGIQGVPTGLTVIDQKIAGFKGGELIILAARPGMGKTAMAALWSMNCAKHLGAVGFLSLEMTNVQLGKRLLALETEYLHANHLYKHGLKNEKEQQEFERLITATEDLPLHIIPKPGMNVFECRLEARRLKQKFDIQMLVVDYLQLMSGAGNNRNANREQVVSEVSRELKKISLELDIPVVALSQLSRAVENRGDKRPLLSDLRESGSIEQDADIVCFLYRDEYYGIMHDAQGNSTEGKCEFIVAKHRNGKLGPVDVGFDDNRVKFHNLDAMHAEYPPFP